MSCNLILKILILGILFSFTSCVDEFQSDQRLDQTTEVHEIKDFVLPDTIEITQDLVIAAYYEMHPKVGCVIFAYTDSTRTNVKKYNYLNDSTFIVTNLVSQKYNVYKEIGAQTSECYLIKPKSVVWEYQLGSIQSSAEYERVDVEN